MQTSDEKDTAPLLIAVLAAGASSRMRGRDKLMETVGGVPLLRLVVKRALATDHPCCVTLPSGGPRWTCLDGLDITRLPVAGAEEGMAASFRTVTRHAEGRAVMIVLADMPEIETEDLLSVISAWQSQANRVVRGACAEERPGSPVILPARLVLRLADLSGDAGGRRLIADEDVLLVPLPGRRALTDLDTPEEWAAWRSRTGIAK